MTADRREYEGTSSCQRRLSYAWRRYRSAADVRASLALMLTLPVELAQCLADASLSSAETPPASSSPASTRTRP